MAALDGAPSPSAVAAAAAAATLTADVAGACGCAPPPLRARRPRGAGATGAPPFPPVGAVAPTMVAPAAVATTAAPTSTAAAAAAAADAAAAAADDVDEEEEPAADAHLPPAAFYLAYIVPLSVLVGYYGRPPLVGPYLTVALIYVLVPLADAAVGTARLFGRWPPSPATGGAEEPAADPAAAAAGGVAQPPSVPPPPPSRARRRPSPTEALAYRLPVYGWLPTQAALLLWAAREAAVGRAAVHPPTFVGLALSVGIVAAGGINVAHELLHRRAPAERAAGVALLAAVGYAHFVVEHAVGHHRRVATVADPASARLGVPFYAFLPRTVCGGWRSAWALEAARLRRRGLPATAHRVGWWAVGTAAGVAALGAAWGCRAVALWAAHAVVAVVILEKVNYMEHYGLVRRRLPGGRPASGNADADVDADADADDDADCVFERVGPHHSWEAPQTLTNVLLFKLQRHADHHQHAGRRYQSLRASPSSPVLPAGYPTMALLVMVPPLWAAVMDGRARRAVASAPPLGGGGGEGGG